MIFNIKIIYNTKTIFQMSVVEMIKRYSLRLAFVLFLVIMSFVVGEIIK